MIRQLNRRTFLQFGASLPGLALVNPSRAAEDEPLKKGKPTKFQIACMTLPYAQFSFERALTGIKAAGYRYVAWYTHQREDGKQVPVVAEDGAPERAKELGKHCR